MENDDNTTKAATLVGAARTFEQRALKAEKSLRMGMIKGAGIGAVVTAVAELILRALGWW